MREKDYRVTQLRAPCQSNSDELSEKKKGENAVKDWQCGWPM